MATTTNYGWTTPNDTDLVKDGAAAIRTLGSSVDTTTKNLNPQTTTGAIAYRSATSNVNTALPIGTAGQVLRVNSGATAPEWATPAGGKVLQVVQATFSTATTVASTSFQDTGLSVSITPSSATSKVLIYGVQQVFAERAETTVGVGIQLVRTSTAVWISGTGGYESLSFNVAPETTTALRGLLPIMYLDSPSTTSATTYKIQGRVFSTANSGTSTYQENSSPSVLIAMEIGA
jgi:hypothetical protein